MTRPEGEVLRSSDYMVKDVDQRTAIEMVENFHYSKGGSKTATHRHGLFLRSDPDNCLGVAWWLPPTKVAAQSVHPDWRRVTSLTRLAINPTVPANGASFLLGSSIKLIRREGKWVALVTYADEGQGHTGSIYRATNWTYVGIRKGHPVWTDSDGRHVATKAGPKNRTSGEMKELGYINTGVTRKHKFIMILKEEQ